MPGRFLCPRPQFDTTPELSALSRGVENPMIPTSSKLERDSESPKSRRAFGRSSTLPRPSRQTSVNAWQCCCEVAPHESGCCERTRKPPCVAGGNHEEHVRAF